MSVQDRDASAPAPPSEFPGWYADPYGEALERFWNGRRWTEKLKDEPTPPVDPAAEPVAVDSPMQRRLTEALSTPPATEAESAVTEVTDAVLRQPAHPGSVFAVSADEPDGADDAKDVAQAALPPRRPPSLFSAAMREERARVTTDDDADTVLDLDELERVEAPALPTRPARPVVRASVADGATPAAPPATVPAGVPAPPGPARASIAAPADRRADAPKPSRPLFERSDDGGFRLPPNDEVGPLSTPPPSSIAAPSTAVPSLAEADDRPDAAVVSSGDAPGRRRAPFWLGLAAAFLCVFGGGVVLGSVLDDATAEDPADVLAPAADAVTEEQSDATEAADTSALDAEIADLEASLAAAESELAEAEAALTAAEADLAAGDDAAASSEELDELRAEVANLEAHRDILLTWFTTETRTRSAATWEAEIARACEALAASGATEATADDVTYTNWHELMGTEADLAAAVTDCLTG